MSGLTKKLIFHYQVDGDPVCPISNPFKIRLNDTIDNPQCMYLLGYTFGGTASPAPPMYWLSCDEPSIPIRIHTNARSNLMFPMFLDNAKSGTDTRLAFWYDQPQIISRVKNSTNRLKDYTLSIFNPDMTLVSWTSMSIWLEVTTPLGDFEMKKTPIRSLPDPSYYDKRMGEEDVETILYR